MEWINAKDELPNKSGMYLTVTKKEDGSSKQDHYYFVHASNTKGNRSYWRGVRKNTQVILWMNMPQIIEET